MSKNCEEIKLDKDELSFLGDGKRFHILQYKDEDKINENFDWKNGNDSSMELQLLNILSDLKIEDNYMPNLEKKYEYYLKINEDSSIIYILYFEDEKKVYTIENLY